jgi:hypothetical protein
LCLLILFWLARFITRSATHSHLFHPLGRNK